MNNWKAIFGTPEKVAETFGYHTRDDGSCCCLVRRFQPLRCPDCKHFRSYATDEEQVAITLEWLQEEAS